MEIEADGNGRADNYVRLAALTPVSHPIPSGTVPPRTDPTMHARCFHRFAAAYPVLIWVGIGAALAGAAEGANLQAPPSLVSDSGPAIGGFAAVPTPPQSVQPPALGAPSAPPGPFADSGEGIDASPSAGLPRFWQWLPDGLIWRSYLAGVQEPRFGLVTSDSSRFGTIWDATLGGRVSLLRYGTPSAYRPEGWEVQFEGAAYPRLQPLEASWPVVSTDFRVGVPLVYAQGPWQFKTGYHHISAHLGDEFMVLNPTAARINYMRDSLMMAVGYYCTESLRLFAEADYAFGCDGGAQPWEFQIGTDFSPAVRGGAPFVAVYGNLRQELDFGGFFVLQGGWQVRGGPALHTFRVGVEYVNGASTQYEFFDDFEQRVGFGIWYDY